MRGQINLLYLMKWKEKRKNKKDMELQVKLYIFRKNSPWGVIKDPIKGNIYTNVINFPNDEINKDFPIGKLKHEFINEHLMEPTTKEINEVKEKLNKIEDKESEEYKSLSWKLERLENSELPHLDWIEELEKQPNKVFNPKHFIKETKWEYDVKINEFNPHNLINADYAVIKFSYDEKIEYKFYTLKILPSNNNIYITFEFELDVFFTYPESTKFKENTENYVLSGHIDRFENWGYITTPKKSILSQIENTDIIPTQNISRKINQNYCGYEPSKKSKEQNFIEKNIIEGLRFLYIYLPIKTKIKNNATIEVQRIEWIKNTYLPYSLLIIPFINKKNWTIKTVLNGTMEIFNLQQVYDMLGVDIPENSIYSMKIEQFLPNSFFTNFKINYEDKEIILVPNKNLLKTEKISSVLTFIFLKLSDDNSENINDNMVWHSKDKIFDLLNLPNFDNIEPILGKLKDIKLETKLLSPQFLKFYLNTWETQKQPFNLITLWDQFCNPGVKNNDILNKIKIEVSFIPEKNNSMIYVGYESENVIKEKNEMGEINNYPGSIINRSFVVIDNNKELPISTKEYSSYMRNNRNKLYMQDVQEGIKIGGGILGGIGAVAGGVISGNWGKIIAGGIAGGIGGIVSGSVGLAKKDHMLKDLQNIPAKITAGTNNTIRNIMNGPLEKGLFFTKTILLKKQSKVLFDKFYRNGYSINELLNLNDVVNSRYYFNKIEAADVFNTLDTTNKMLSTQIKQIISDTYASGLLVIWHYRKKETFNFMNYKIENWEMNLINNTLRNIPISDMPIINNVKNPLISSGEYQNVIITNQEIKEDEEGKITAENELERRKEEEKQNNIEEKADLKRRINRTIDSFEITKDKKIIRDWKRVHEKLHTGEWKAFFMRRNHFYSSKPDENLYCLSPIENNYSFVELGVNNSSLSLFRHYAEINSDGTIKKYGLSIVEILDVIKNDFGYSLKVKPEKRDITLYSQYVDDPYVSQKFKDDEITNREVNEFKILRTYDEITIRKTRDNYFINHKHNLKWEKFMEVFPIGGYTQLKDRYTMRYTFYFE